MSKLLACLLICCSIFKIATCASILPNDDEDIRDVVNRLNQNERRASGPSGGDVSVDSIKRQFDYDSDDDDDDDDLDEDGDKCIICYAGFKKSPPIELTCGHKYHEQCLADYYSQMKKIDSCFLCKKPFELKDGTDFKEVLFLKVHEQAAENRLRLGMRAALSKLPLDYRERPNV